MSAFWSMVAPRFWNSAPRLPASTCHTQSRPVIPPVRYRRPIVWVSCHDEEALKHAERLGADYAFLSPVRVTRTHPDRPAIGWERFRAMTESVSLPVYGLGGLGPGDLEAVRTRGGCGVAGIRFWWDTKGEFS